MSRMPGNFDIEDKNPGGENAPDMDAFIRAVNQLPVYERALITLYLEDLSGKEMADITGLSEANVRVKIHRIKERLCELTKVVTEKEVCHEF